MNHQKKILLLTIPILLGTACLHGPTAVKNDLSQAAGVELEQEFGITLGRVGTWFAKQGVKIAGKHSDDMEGIPSLKGIRKVSVGVYQVRGLRPGYENRRNLTMKDMDLGPAWYTLVRVREPGEDVFVLAKENDSGEKITGMLVVVAERDEWVLVKVKGNLSRVIEEGMRYAFDEIDRPDLYQATRRERGMDPYEYEARRHRDDDDSRPTSETLLQEDYESCADLIGTGSGL